MHEAASTSANEAALELLRHGASPFVVNRHSALPHARSRGLPAASLYRKTRICFRADETAYEISMRRDNKHLLRLIERYARISAFMQVRLL